MSRKYLGKKSVKVLSVKTKKFKILWFVYRKSKITTKVYLKPLLNGFFSKAKPVKNFTNKNLVTEKITYDCTINVQYA